MRKAYQDMTIVGFLFNSKAFKEYKRRLIRVEIIPFFQKKKKSGKNKKKRINKIATWEMKKSPLKDLYKKMPSAAEHWR